MPMNVKKKALWMPSNSTDTSSRHIQNTNATPLFPAPQFFSTDTLNITEFLLRNGKDDNVAIHFAREGVVGIEKATWQELRSRTRALYDAMVNSGMQVGDVVASVILNSIDAIVICLATLAIGALWSSASCQDAIVDRFAQVMPKIIFVDDGYIYARKLTKLEDRIRQWPHKLGQSSTNLSAVVILPYCNLPIDLSRICKGCWMETFVHRGTGLELAFRYLPFGHPAFIVYSSGTVMAQKMGLQNVSFTPLV